VLVGSQEPQPAPGWPHAAILGDLTKNPTMTPAELGVDIVQRYTEFHRHTEEAASQSAIDLNQLDDLVAAVDTLARRLLSDMKSTAVASALRHARGWTLRFFDGLYVDLHHLAHNLIADLRTGPVADAAHEVQRVIDGHGTPTPILAEGHGAGLKPARGISIDFPSERQPSAYYRDLDFARRTRWADFLDAYLGAR
jgi:hypothetical protein